MNRNVTILVTLLLFSCSHEIFIDPINIEQELVVNAFVQPGLNDSLLLSSTFNSLTSSDFFEGHAIYKGISGAKVVVLAGRDTVGHYVEAKNKSYHYEGENFEENKEYRLEISHPDYPSVSANTKIPVVPEFGFGTYAENGMKVSISKYFPQVLLEFDDNMDTKDFYLVTASCTYKRYYHDWVLIDSVDWMYEDVMIEYLEDKGALLNSKSPIIEMTNYWSSYDFAQQSLDWDYNYGVNRTGIIFSDKLFNGQKVSIPVDLSFYEFRNTTIIHLTLTSISEEYYLLFRSLATLAKTNDGFFPEALQLYSNVHNGHGVWAAKSSKTISLDISELDLFNYE